MACAVLLALTCAAAASASYADYSGVKMPAYGGGGDYEAPRDTAVAMPPDDYHGHSPDGAASLDYKYEEEPRIKTEKPTKDSDDSELWRKPGRKQRGLMRPMDTNADVSKYERDEEDVPKFRSSHRYPKHRSRLKSDQPSGDEESPSRRPIKYSRDRKEDVSDIDRKNYFHVDKEDFPDDKSKEFDEEVKFVNEATTRRVNRRKPRDRHLKRKSDNEGFEDDLEADRHVKTDSDKEILPRRTRPIETRTRDRFRPVIDDEDEDLTKVQPLNKLKTKTYDEYDDYYDMKRVYNIKSKLPSLLRRTTEGAQHRSTTSYLEMLWTNRRLLPRVSAEDIDETAPTQARVTPTTTVSTTTTTATTTTITTTPTLTSKTTNSTTTVSSSHANASALSLFEKSRLSILKKDQRKEGQHMDPPTKKPPVLLQVTRHLPTVVMVEPPSSVKPWMRAQELSEDTPERIEKVKKLMRHKLVSEAKNIRDLTDNWDDLVCDYIDVALIDSGAKPPTTLSRIIVLFSLVLIPCVCYV